MPSYEDLAVFQRSHRLTLDVYDLSADFPRNERFELTPQIRRSASSIPMNIAEGAGRFSSKDYRRFLGIAAGSANELAYQLRLAADLGYADKSLIDALRQEAHEVKRMLRGLSRHLESSD